MRCRFVLLAAAPALASPAWSTVYLTVDQAKTALFPGVALVRDDRTLSDAQAAAIRSRSGVSVHSRDVHSWRAPDGARLIVDQVLGTHETITLALALDPAGAVRGLEILDYRESYGGQVRDPAWRAQFTGKRDGAPLELGRDIRNNSGGTLSARHVADGVRRLLATERIVFAQH
ncbi:FMN-binding protein [Sphingomonas sp. BK235]|uniref:FMN-binding protein n=1 Tax=Sphingomonas sp. BK235 TaxID=2512131 RepID=UPI0010474E48|nr:FMN-binding protein [Sphingomonas sp. BK235]TCP35968.1 FMN-binding protein [Sphingomonas sp. BK235]